MAQRVHIVLEDDIDGGDATETLLFGLDGISYEIDLSDKNASKLRDAMAKYIASARRTSGPRSRRAARRSTAGPTTAQVREWARSNGYDVSDRGRISAEIRAAYEAAN
jgi:nucleoid-associated protein Lsr2